MAIKPIVRYMLVCDDWKLEGNDKRIEILGLISNIHALDDPPFPLLHEELCVLLLLTDGHGNGDAYIKCVYDETGLTVFETTPRTISFQSSPLNVVGIPFRVRDCVFPNAGMYTFQFWYDVEKLAEQPVRLR